MKPMRFKIFVLVAALFCSAAFAQETVSPTLPDKIMRPMRAVGTTVLKAEGINIHLWGIKPAMSAETPLELRALILMDSLTREQQVSCKVVGGTITDVIARCTAVDDKDIALELLNNGFAIVDRQATYDSVFASAYERAQEQARQGGKGVWKIVTSEGSGGSAIDGYMILVLVLGPFFGMLAVAGVMWYWLQHISQARKRESEETKANENLMQARERRVLASTLEGELMDNKSKIEAFLFIYGDLLQDLKNTATVPKYQQAGDIIQKHPSFSKTVFEANVGKLSLLDMHLAGRVSKLYSALPKEHAYIELDTGVPLETAVKLVERIMEEAKELLEPIDTIIAELHAMEHD